MKSNIQFYAGEKALAHIKKHGLSVNDIQAVYGASGAAKWLAIYGLDQAVFGHWLAQAEHIIDVYGTSVGAFKLSAAVGNQPVEDLTSLADAYVEQHYEGKITRSDVDRETHRILDSILTEDAIAGILDNSRFRYHCGVVRCHGLLASQQDFLQKMGMVTSFGHSMTGRSGHTKVLDRVIFSSDLKHSTLTGRDDFTTNVVQLDQQNIRQAITASGSIPVVMQGVHDIPGAGPGVYHDGGLLDYHPVPDNIQPASEGIVLYPHFYPYLKEGWFDKFYPWRKLSPQRLSNVLMVSPSSQYVASLPGGYIPDRQDFKRFAKDNAKRKQRWREVMLRSQDMGEEFLQIVKSGDVFAHIKPFS
ncbi:MAG: patatin-like phospholipase family protein [Pseudomonadales bacterium]